MAKLEILNPYALTLILLAGLLLLWSLRSIDPLSKRRRWISLGTRLLLFVLLVLALADPRWRADSEKRSVAFLIDVSRSVGGNAVETFQSYIENPEEGAVFDHHRFIAFAGRQALLESPEDLDDLLPQELNESKTDIGAALRFAQASFPPGYKRDIIVFTDGRSPADWAEEADALRRSGVRVHPVQVDPPEDPEALVRSVRAPSKVKEEEPFELEAEIVATEETEATISVYRQGGKVHEETVTLKPGQNRYSFTQTITNDKITEYIIEVEADGDSIIDNNQLSAVVNATGKSKVLMITDEERQSRYLGQALKQEGILLDTRPAVGAPTTLADIQNYDLLIIDNVPATDLKRSQQELYSSYVRDFGGGLMMLGGDDSFGLGGYYRSPIEEVLPVKSDFEKEKENPSLGLALIIDKSGSMNGMKIEMAKAAAKAAVELLSANDYAGVVVFDGQAFWVAELKPVVDKFGLMQLISSIQPGGGTNMSPAMELAYTQLSSIPAKLKHVIILTDGRSRDGPFAELTTQMTQEQITVSTVGVGRTSDIALLEQIARWGNGRFYYTDESEVQGIPQIFAKETMTASKSAIKEMPFQPQVVREASFFEDIDFGLAPFLYGYVTTEAKPTAEIWLATERGDPLLATWRYGLGNVAAFTSDARNRWAGEWLRWQGYGPFWAQLVRHLSRSGSLEPYPVEITNTPDGKRLTVEAVDNQGNFLSDVRGRVLAIGPDGERHDLEMSSDLPGKFTANIPASLKGSYHFNVQMEDSEGNPLNQQNLSTSVGYPPEFLLQSADESALRKVAESTGGFYNPTLAEVAAEDDRVASREVELWPWLLAAALGVFLLDVAFKRWPDERGQ